MASTGLRVVTFSGKVSSRGTRQVAQTHHPTKHNATGLRIHVATPAPKNVGILRLHGGSPASWRRPEATSYPHRAWQYF